jgi:AhpD family alkylhydroperoxidase
MINQGARTMHKDWPTMASELTTAIKEVRHGSPEVLKAFYSMAQAATKGRALDTKTKELLAVGIAIAIRCDGCIAFHTQAAVKAGATREEIMEVSGMALYMGAGPSLMYAAQAVEAFDQFSRQKPA